MARVAWTVSSTIGNIRYRSLGSPALGVHRRKTRLILIRKIHFSAQPMMEPDRSDGSPPPLAWKRNLGLSSKELREFKPTIMEILKMLGFIGRLWKHSRDEGAKGRRAPIDPFHVRNKASPSQGVPLGGIGGGSIGRGWRGDFMRWQLNPCVCEESSVMANQFSAFTTRGKQGGGKQKLCSVLFAGNPSLEDGNGISSWKWNLKGESCTYYGLFPRAWTTYNGQPDPDLQITCRQISPFLPHNYKESSFPCCVFAYELTNTGDEDVDVTLLFTWANSIAEKSELAGNHEHAPFVEEDGVRGVLLRHRSDGRALTFAIAAKETNDSAVSVCPCFVVSGGLEGQFPTAKDIWKEIEEKGCFDESNWEASTAVSLPESVTAAAVAVNVRVPTHGKKTVTFGLAWDSPTAKFLDGKSYNRRYTKFYGKSGNVAAKLVHDAISDFRNWETEISAWQRPILEDTSLPEWYRYTLFNELYYLVAGGTIWIEDEISETTPENHTLVSDVSDALLQVIDANKSSPDSFRWSFPVAREPCVGRLLYLESLEYILWNTYDVHFYASYALLALFPKLELNLQQDFAAATLLHDSEEVDYLVHGGKGLRSLFGAVPHDLGTFDPWDKINSYNLHNTDFWKDLNSKFVIQAYRDAAATGDDAFARAIWPAVYAAMAYMDQFDRDRDGMIENDGFPDQTYDLWTTKGISAYCGGLWVAALQAASAMATRVGDVNSARLFYHKFLRAKQVYDQSLWNGSYFNYDGSGNASKSIQSDQLAGQWYSLASGLPAIVDTDKAVVALQKIFEFNVMRLSGGDMGAVNGMQPDGQVDSTSMQSREIWTGSTYAVAALMIHHGMREQGFKTAEGVFRNAWSEQGQSYAFQTPEAWTTDGNYRALAYMRPLSIWAMQWALSPPKQLQPPMLDTSGSFSDEGFNRLARELKELAAASSSQQQDRNADRKTYSSSSLWAYILGTLRR